MPVLEIIYTIRGLLRLIAFSLWTLCIITIQIPVILIVPKTNLSVRLWLPRFWHKGVCVIFDLRARIMGKPICNQQTLFLANHLSYFDIVLLGSILEGSFIAKKDVESWPVFGFLAKLQDTVFISRERRSAMLEKQKLAQRFESNQTLILFPEGTSSDGREVLPFKSSLFSTFFEPSPSSPSTKQPAILIQPVTLVMKPANNNDTAEIPQHIRDQYAWYGDMELAPHLWQFVKKGCARIDVIFHKPLNISEFETRKDLARTSHNIISGPINNPVNNAVNDIAHMKKITCNLAEDNQI